MRSIKVMMLLVVVAIFSGLAFGQAGGAYSTTSITLCSSPSVNPTALCIMPSVQVQVCSIGTYTAACPSPIALCTDTTCSNRTSPNPFPPSATGNVLFYAPPGNYTVQYLGLTGTLLFEQPATVGAGTMTPYPGVSSDGNGGLTVAGSVAVGTALPGGAPANSVAIAGKYYGDGSQLSNLPLPTTAQVQAAINGQAITPSTVAAGTTILTGINPNATVSSSATGIVSSLKQIAALWVFGDSYTLGRGATNQNVTGNTALIQRDTQATTYQYSVGSTSSGQIVNSAFQYFLPNATLPSAAWVDGGANDAQVDTCGGTVGTNCTKNFQSAMMALEAWLSIPYQYRQMASTATATGSWAADATLPIAANVYASPGTPIDTSTGGTLTFSVPSSASGKIGLTYTVTNSQVGTFNVSIDGTLQTDLCSSTTTFSSGPCGGVTLAHQSGTSALSSAFFRQEWTVTSGISHTVVVTAASGNNVSIAAIDWIPPSSTANTNAVFVMGVGQAFVNNATYNTVSKSVVTQLAGDGLPVYFVDIQTGTPGLNNTTDMATTATATCPASAAASHPNDCGHLHIYQTFYNTEVANGYVFTSFQASGTGPISNAVVSDGAGDVSLYSGAGNIFLWPSNGTSATSLEVKPVTGVTITAPATTTLSLLSGASGSYMQMLLGRTSQDAIIQIAGASGQGATNAAAGDTVFKAVGNLWLAGSNSSGTNNVEINTSSTTFGMPNIIAQSGSATTAEAVKIGRTGTDLTVQVDGAAGQGVTAAAQGDSIVKAVGTLWLAGSNSSSQSVSVTSSALTSTVPLVLSGLGSSTAPVCPNGTNGALTTSGCATGSSLATSSSPGIVQPDNTSITVNGSGVISAAATNSIRVANGICTGTATASNSGTLTIFGMGTGNTACTGTTSSCLGSGVMPSSGTVSKLTVSAGTTGVNSSSGVFILWDLVNGTTSVPVNTGLTVTYGTTTAGTAVQDTTHTYNYAMGDRLCVRFSTQTGETLANISVAFNY